MAVSQTVGIWILARHAETGKAQKSLFKDGIAMPHSFVPKHDTNQEDCI